MAGEHNAGLGDVAITFSNTIFEAGRWGVIYIFHNQGTVDYVAPDRVVLNGTINAIGDTVDVFYNDAHYSFTVSAYDNAGDAAAGAKSLATK